MTGYAKARAPHEKRNVAVSAIEWHMTKRHALGVLALLALASFQYLPSLKLSVSVMSEIEALTAMSFWNPTADIRAAPYVVDFQPSGGIS